LSSYANLFKVQIIALVNGYDAMILDHPCRCESTSRQTIQSLREGRYKQWHAYVVNAFVDMSQQSWISSHRTPLKREFSL
jgi:HD-GYP domain-containing protein (c-di-GMP phosphodiesterase class II)